MSEEGDVCDCVTESEGSFDIDRAKLMFIMFFDANPHFPIGSSPSTDVEQRDIARHLEDNDINTPGVFWNIRSERLEPGQQRRSRRLDDVQKARTESKTSN